MINYNTDEYTLDVFITLNFIKHKNESLVRFYDYLNFIHIINDEKQSDLLKSSIKSRIMRNGKLRFFVEILKTYYGIIIEKIVIKELDLTVYNLGNKNLRERLKASNFNLKINYLKYFDGSIYLNLLKQRFSINPTIIFSQKDMQNAIMNDYLFKNLKFFIENEEFISINKLVNPFSNIFLTYEKPSDKNFLSVLYNFIYLNISKIQFTYLDFYDLSHFAKYQSTTTITIFQTFLKELEDFNGKILIICNNSDHLYNESTKFYYEKLIDLGKRLNRKIFIININTISSENQIDFKEFTKYEFNSNMIMDISKSFMEKQVEIYDKDMIIQLAQDINRYSFEEIQTSKQSLYDFIFYKARKIDFIELEKLVNPIF